MKILGKYPSCTENNQYSHISDKLQLDPLFDSHTLKQFEGRFQDFQDRETAYDIMTHSTL